ncbi:MAG: DUF4340 domain-containing protein [Geminicoccaceae bacterium]
MTPKTFLGLVAVTFATSVGAIITVVNQPTTAPVAYVDEPAFPTLRAEPDAVAKITIQTMGGSVTLTRSSPETWIAPDRYEYPAAAEKISKLVRQLNDMRLIEPKTSNADRYARLEVEDLVDESKSRLIRLEDGQGNVLAEALIGKRLLKLTGTQSSGTYIRRPGESQSWLASGSFDLEPEIEIWLDQLIVEIDRDQIARIEVTPIEGDGYVVLRESNEAEPVIEGLAEGETLKADSNLAQLTSVLTSVTLADVQPKGEVAWPDARHQVKVRTFGGLDLTIELVLVDDKPWATFSAAIAALPEDPALADALNQEAEAINNRANAWVYHINQSLFQRLTKPRSSWLEASDGTS